MTRQVHITAEPGMASSDTRTSISEALDETPPLEEDEDLELVVDITDVDAEFVAGMIEEVREDPLFTAETVTFHMNR